MQNVRFIHSFIYVIGGRTQKTGEDTGMMRLWARLFRWRADHPVHGSMFLMPREWNDDTKQLAALLERYATVEGRPRIVIAAYSWGAGYGAIRLAKSLARRGRMVDLLLLIDPVYRSRLPLMFRLLAFTTWFGIRVPANVRRVLTWRQHNAGPRGTNVRSADSARTCIIAQRDVTGLGLTHVTIQYHEPILEECARRAIDAIKAMDDPDQGEVKSVDA